jgi:hypothetical protein
VSSTPAVRARSAVALGYEPRGDADLVQETAHRARLGTCFAASPHDSGHLEPLRQIAT